MKQPRSVTADVGKVGKAPWHFPWVADLREAGGRGGEEGGGEEVRAASGGSPLKPFGSDGGRGDGAEPEEGREELYGCGRKPPALLRGVSFPGKPFFLLDLASEVPARGCLFKGVG